MATQFKNDSFSETLPLDEAMEKFSEFAQEGLAKALHVGSREEIEAVKNEVSLKDKISELSNRVADIQAEKTSLILKPLAKEIRKYGGTDTD